ncbi:hypothetical protein BDW22DRAFT_1339856 [Trametopsis cervina]|nr:hypothetical protein BDW22DRAFT_1339856 [Trametopsis cervina]
MVRPDQTDWVDKLSIVEFALNSMVSSATGFAPFELNGGYLSRMITASPVTELPGVQQFATQVLENLEQAQDQIIESQMFQTYHANRRQHDENMQNSQ